MERGDLLRLCWWKRFKQFSSVQSLWQLGESDLVRLLGEFAGPLLFLEDLDFRLSVLIILGDSDLGRLGEPDRFKLPDLAIALPRPCLKSRLRLMSWLPGSGEL